MAEKGPMTRSSREALSKKVVTSGSATLNRKSERVDKRMPPSPAVKMDQKRKTTTPSPLRRSERTKNASLSDASASKSKSSGSKKHFTGKQLVFEASGDGEEGGSEASSRNRPKRMTTGEYLALFVKPRRVDLSDSHEEANGMDRSTQEGDCHEKTDGNDRPTQEDCLEKTNSIDMSTQDCHEKTNGNERPTQEDCLEKSNQVDRLTQEGDDGGGRKIDGEKIDECLNGNCLDYAKDDKVVLPSEDATGKEMITEPKLSGPVKELLDDNVTVNSLVLTNASTCEPSRAHESFLFDSGKEETLQMLGLRDSVSNENLIRKCVEHDKGEKSISSKRKRTVVDMQSDGSAMLADNDNSNLIEDVRSSRICGNVVETNGSCSKRIR
ncbi:hypothetical protein VNO78_05712 [Psophocarpus tetragonolobus]|uniref:Uncharacterized protein n=1 Tax=Psophocarpus tetragonolobus TaxID=3891 RepID=A0AAN9XQY7_PSOTE